MKIGTKSIWLIPILILAISSFYSCSKKENTIPISLKESQSICANWKGKSSKHGEVYAARFVLQSKDKQLFNYNFYFSNDAFYVNSLDTTLSIKNIGLVKGKNIRELKGLDGYEVTFYLKPQDITTFFPSKAHRLGDDCYTSELGNMIGSGIVSMKLSEKLIEIEKSKSFKIFIGPKRRN